MGIFNTIMVNCPNCGSKIEFQSKSGSCILATYHISNCPEEEIEGIIGESWCCDNCGTEITIGNKEKEYKNFSFLVKGER